MERDGLLEAARELGVSVIAYSPLGQGCLSGAVGSAEHGPRARLREELAAVARAAGTTVSGVALAWLLARGDDFVAIPGATRAAHVIDAVAALDLTLDAAARDLLDEASRPFLSP